MKFQVRIGAVMAVCLLETFLVLAQTEVKDFKPVTDAMLLKPDPADWLNWRRTLDGWGYSPLNQITRRNVGQLQLAWSWRMQDGANQTTPLVYDGVMYLPSPNGVQALDAATGEFIWQYDRAPMAWRNIAIYGDKVLAATGQAHLIALDARTGKLVWDHTVADNKLGYKYTSGPIVVKGKVIAGMTGCERYKDDVCFISAHDVETGKQLWRTSTVARPGEPGGDTWGDLPLEFRAGSDAWIPGSYDPATNLIYWGTSQAKPWASAQRGTGGGAELYTNSALALDPDTGKIVWYHQFIPTETHDLDEVFENILVDRDGRQSLFKMGKIGVLWELDRKTGKFLNAFDLGYQNVVDIDKKTGRATYRPETVPKLDVPLKYCPGPGGLKTLYAMAYHPETAALYIPLKLNCASSTFGTPKPKALGDSGYAAPSKRLGVPHPANPNDIGEFVAMDSRSGKILWRRRNRVAWDTAALTTAGGLVFVGDYDRYVYAFDVSNGDLLWRTRTPTPPDGFPITYAVRGRQYVAVPAGPAGWRAAWVYDISTRMPGFRRARGSPTILVFALPETQGRPLRN